MRHGKSGGCTKEFDIGRRIFRWDKVNLDIFWLKDESLEDSAKLPDPDVIAAEIVENLEAALAQLAGENRGQATNLDSGEERNRALAEQLAVFRRLPAGFAGMGGIA